MFRDQCWKCLEGSEFEFCCFVSDGGDKVVWRPQDRHGECGLAGGDDHWRPPHPQTPWRGDGRAWKRSVAQLRGGPGGQAEWQPQPRGDFQNGSRISVFYRVGHQAWTTSLSCQLCITKPALHFDALRSPLPLYCRHQQRLLVWSVTEDSPRQGPATFSPRWFNPSCQGKGYNFTTSLGSPANATIELKQVGGD